MSFKLLKGSQLRAFFHRPQCIYCYTEFKIRYLNNLKLFSVGKKKELIEPIVLRKKADGVLLFLKVLSSGIDLLVTLGDFTVKNAKFGRKVCI